MRERKQQSANTHRCNTPALLILNLHLNGAIPSSKNARVAWNHSRIVSDWFAWTGSTNMNEHSSRSHAIFTIYLEQLVEGPTPAEENADPNRPPTVSFVTAKFHLVDLAGGASCRCIFLVLDLNGNRFCMLAAHLSLDWKHVILDSYWVMAVVFLIIYLAQQ
jgi:hypothetical protein